MKEYKAFPLLECKAAEGGEFSGYAAAYAKDVYGDRIAPGAFAQTIKDQKGKIPIFLNHDTTDWIGFSTEMEEDSKGLYIKAILSLDSSKGADTAALLRMAKQVDYRVGLSIGFTAEEVEYDDASGGRLLKSINLWETSITPFPANKKARIDSIKSIRNIEQILRDVGGCSKESAKRAYAMLRPYLLADASGQPLPPERDVREQGPSELVAAIRAWRPQEQSNAR
jgi:HK97 family phage prohead protease